MLILSLDTTAKTAAVCISELDVQSEGLRLFAEARFTGTLTHSENLLPMIDFCFKGCGKTIQDVDLIAVSAGPGSFTGVRIGISTVKGLAFARDRQALTPCLCVPVSALQALAYQCALAERGTLVLSVMDARRSQVYAALFEIGDNQTVRRLMPDRILTTNELYLEMAHCTARDRRVMLAGDGARLCFCDFTDFSRAGLAAADPAEPCDSVFSFFLAGEPQLHQDAFSVARAGAAAYCESLREQGQDLSTNYSANALAPVYLRASSAERNRAAESASRISQPGANGS